MVAERLTPNRIDRHLLNWRFWGSVLVAEFVWCHSAMAAPPSSEPVPAFLARHCQGCHSGTKPKGNFRLDSLTPDLSSKASREKWLKVLEQVKSDTMPPKEKPRPSAQEVKAVTDWISGHVAKAVSADSATQGRVVLHRLNRAEYENTVRDLLGVDIDLKDLLPADALTNGFDNNAESLHVSSFLMEQYLEAADKVLDAAIVNGPRPWMIKKRFDIRAEKSVKPKGSVYRHLEDGVAIFSSWVSANIQVTLWNFSHRISAAITASASPRMLSNRQAHHLSRDWPALSASRPKSASSAITKFRRASRR